MIKHKCIYYSILFIVVGFIVINMIYANSFYDYSIVAIDSNTVIRPTNGEIGKHVIYRSNQPHIHSLSVSPDNKHIAFIEQSNPSYDTDSYQTQPNTDLRIIDFAGTTIRIIEEDIVRYVWSPDGNRLAYVTFDPCDPDYAYKCPTGAWVHDLLASETIKIKDSMTEIFWANFDSTLYLLNRDSVFAWKPGFPEPILSNHLGIYFSPDGRYYLRLWKDENDPIQLFSTANDQKMNLPTHLGGLWGTHDLNPPHGWAYNSAHILLFIKEDVEVETEGTSPIQIINSRKVIKTTISLYDPSEQKTIRQFEGEISNCIGNGDFLIIEQDGRLSFKKME